MTTNNICYLYSAETGIELIFCKDSTISYPMHNHVSVLTIGIILNGSLVLTVNKETKGYKQNETFVIYPYVPHSISTHNSYTLLSLCIDKNVIKNVDVNTIQKHIQLLLMQALNMEKVNNPVASNGIVDSRDIRPISTHTQLLGSLLAEINQYQILQLLNCLSKIGDFSNCQPQNHTPYIHDLKSQLELHPECKLTVEEMAQNVFLSKYHFIRSFKAEVGLTPHQFQIQNRIRKAQRLIREANTITKVALTSGFCDQSHFIKQFKKYVGLPPLAYKSSFGIVPQNKSIPSGTHMLFSEFKEI